MVLIDGTGPPPPPAYSSRAMLAVVENIATAAMAKPQKAKELLRGVVESILMTPAEDGYAVRVAMKSISPAALEGDGAGVYEVGCGGLLLPSTNHSFDRTFGLPRIHPTLFRTSPSPT